MMMMMNADLVPWCIVDDLRLWLVVSYVQFETVKSPRDKDDRTSLVVEREVSHVQRTVHLDDRWEHPQHVTSWRHDRLRRHKVAEAVVSAASRININTAADEWAIESVRALINGAKIMQNASLIDSRCVFRACWK